MKKSLFAAMAFLALFCSIQSSAQTFGLKAGYSASSFQGLDLSSTDLDEKMISTMHFGPTMEINLNKILSFETALLLVNKGEKRQSNESYRQIVGHHLKELTKLSYLQIPITIKIGHQFGDWKLYSTAGAYGSYAIKGMHNKITHNENNAFLISEGTAEGSNIKFGNNLEEGATIKKFDAGLTVGLGIEYKAYQFGLSYDHGLVEIYNYENLQTQNRSIHVSIGYRFGKNKS